MKLRWNISFSKGLLIKLCSILNASVQTPNLLNIDFYRGSSKVKEKSIFLRIFTSWKVSKYGVFFSLYFPVFVLNTEISYSVQIQENTDQKKPRIWTRFTQWLEGKKTPSNKIPALTESMNKDICVVSTLNQLFIRGS